MCVGLESIWLFPGRWLDIADDLTPPAFGLFRIAPHRVRLGENPDRPVLAVGIDHGQRFRFRGVKNRDGFPDVHAGMQHDIPVMQEADQTIRRLDIGRVRVGHQRQPDIAAGAVDRDDMGLRPPAGICRGIPRLPCWRSRRRRPAASGSAP